MGLTKVVVYPFSMAGDQFLPLEVGEFVVVSEETEDWYRGRFLGWSGCSPGIFPKNHVNVISERETDTIHPSTTLERALIMFVLFS